MSEQTINVTITESQPINFKIEEAQPIIVKLEGYSFITGAGVYDACSLQNMIIQEEPTKITTKKFRTAYNYVSGLLKVFYNGLKERNIIEVSSNEFELPIDTITGDIIEVEYYKTT